MWALFLGDWRQQPLADALEAHGRPAVVGQTFRQLAQKQRNREDAMEKKKAAREAEEATRLSTDKGRRGGHRPRPMPVEPPVTKAHSAPYFFLRSCVPLNRMYKRGRT